MSPCLSIQPSVLPVYLGLSVSWKCNNGSLLTCLCSFACLMSLCSYLHAVVCYSVCLSIYPTVCLPVFLSLLISWRCMYGSSLTCLCLFACLVHGPAVYSVCLSIFPTVCLPVFLGRSVWWRRSNGSLFPCLSVFARLVSVCLRVYLSVYLCFSVYRSREGVIMAACSAAVRRVMRVTGRASTVCAAPVTSPRNNRRPSRLLCRRQGISRALCWGQNAPPLHG